METVAAALDLDYGEFRRISSMGWNQEGLYSTYVPCFGVNNTQGFEFDTKGFYNYKNDGRVYGVIIKVYPHMRNELVYYMGLDKEQRKNYLGAWLSDSYYGNNYRWFIYDFENGCYEPFEFYPSYWDNKSSELGITRTPVRCG